MYLASQHWKKTTGMSSIGHPISEKPIAIHGAEATVLSYALHRLVSWLLCCCCFWSTMLDSLKVLLHWTVFTECFSTLWHLELSCNTVSKFWLPCLLSFTSFLLNWGQSAVGSHGQKLHCWASAIWLWIQKLIALSQFLKISTWLRWLLPCHSSL